MFVNIIADIHMKIKVFADLSKNGDFVLFIFDNITVVLYNKLHLSIGGKYVRTYE